MSKTLMAKRLAEEYNFSSQEDRNQALRMASELIDRETNLPALLESHARLVEALKNTTQTLRLCLIPLPDADARAEVRNEIKLAEVALAKAKEIQP